MLKETEIYPRFLDNAPLGEDLYESQSQNRIATSIANHIKSKSNNKTLIGLDGDWGSGKSNTISIIERQLGDNYYTFIYDTWAHQEDLQRRSFLEEFTASLATVKLIDQEVWNLKLKTLLAKIKESSKKTIPKLSNAIVISIISLIVIPIAKLLSESTEIIWLKYLFASIPLLIVLAFWLYMRWYKKKKLSLQDLFYIYKERDLEEISQETISEDEPSVRKFRIWLSDLSDALNKDVIIVFDNMDRLPSDKIKTIWTLIHTFFSSKPLPKITVIVPFDRKHIQNAFGELNDSHPDFENLDGENERINHFINKTFSVVFNVPPGILSDWKRLFHNKYQEAFGVAEDEEFLITRSLFNIHNKSITPRKIIAFINELVAYKLLWQDEMPLRHIALFVLNKDLIASNPTKHILDGAVLKKSKNLFGGDETVADKMSALFYNIKLETAGQVTFQREIEFAIRDGQYEELKDYKNSPYFLSILEQIDLDDIPIDNSVTALEILQQDEAIAIQETQLRVLWSRLMGRQMSVNIDTLLLKESHKILIKNCPELKRKILVNNFVQQFYKLDPFQGKQYYHTLKDLTEFTASLEPSIDLLLYTKEKHVDARNFATYLDAAKEDVMKFKVRTNISELETYFLEKIPEFINECENLIFLKERLSFKKIKHKIETLIDQDEILLTNVLSVFNVYRAVTDLENVDSFNKKLDDETIDRLLNEANEKSVEFSELLSMRIARGTNYEGSLASNFTTLQDALLIDSIVLKIQDYNNIGALILDGLDSKYPLTISVVRKIIIEQKGRRLAIRRLLPKFQEITEVYSISPVELFKFLNAWNSYLSDAIMDTSLDKLIPEISVYESATTIDLPITSIIIRQSQKLIEESSEADFLSSFMDSKSFLFNLLTVLLKTRKLKSLPEPAFNAYKSAIKSIANSEDSELVKNLKEDHWRILYDSSDKNHLQPIIKDIRDHFLRKTDITYEYFIFFEQLLREYGNLEDFAGEAVRKILTPMIEDEQCLGLIIDSEDYYTRLILKGENDSYELIDNVRDKVESDSSIEDYRKLDQAIGKKISDHLSIHQANILFEKDGTSESVDIQHYFKDFAISNLLHFKTEAIRSMDNFPDLDQFELQIFYAIDGREYNKIFDHNRWVRIP